MSEGLARENTSEPAIREEQLWRPTAAGGVQLAIEGLTPILCAFMAKTSWINRNERKRATTKKYAALRAELKAKKDYAGLTQLPRDASPTRVVNRCEVTGRRRAFIRRFKISRLTFRELASQGLIPGVTKSSW
jgi:small subunit ribosomal protein S14